MQLPLQIAQAYGLVSAGRAGEALLLLGNLAAQGDGPSLYQLAEWRREGALLPKDLPLARDLYRRSGEAGIVEGKRRYIALLAAGIGGDRDWARSLKLLAELARLDPAAKRQLSLVRSMKLDRDGNPSAVPKGEEVYGVPGLLRFRRLLSEGECNYLAQAAEPLFEPALTYDEREKQAFLNPIRTSDTAVFPWVGENPAVHALNRRLAAASGTDVAQGEPLQVLRYAPGQEYKPHIDAIPGLDNQRILTMLVFLNDGFEGGGTHFVKHGATVSPRRGDALCWGNVDAGGRPDADMVHAGLPVTKGVKLLASRWIRERPVTD